MKLTADSEPASAPGSPLPLRSVPPAVEEAHEITVPVLVSLRPMRPDVAVMAPPGWMVQVVAAKAGAAPRVAAS